MLVNKQKSKKVGIIGHFGGTENYLDGQTIKSKTLYSELCRLTDWEIVCVDTFLIRRPIKLLLHSLRCLFTCQNIIILLAENGMRFYFPLLYYWQKFFKLNIYHDVIGGFLAEYVDKHPKWKKYLNAFVINWVEFSGLKHSLENKGITNADIMPNFKRLDMTYSDYTDKQIYRFCTFSRVSKAKGIPDAVEAIERINREFGNIAALDIYGQVDNDYAGDFEKLKDTFSGAVKYKGAIDYSKSTSILKNYYALLFPTFYEGEGFPGTIIDAFASSLPVLATDWHANAEIITHKKTGLIYPDGELQTLEAAIKWSIEHPEALHAMRLTCAETSKQYIPEKVVGTLIDFINSKAYPDEKICKEDGMARKILILTTDRFPDGDAGAVRQYTFCRLFAFMGYAPFVIGMGPSTEFKEKTYKAIRYMSFRGTDASPISRLGYLLNYKRRLRQFLNDNRFSDIFVEDIPVNALFFLKKFAQKNKVNLYHDSVEWFSPHQFRMRKLSNVYFSNNMYNKRWIDSCFRVIAISTYLENHFKSRGLRTIRIPVIMDMEEVLYNKKTDPQKLTLLYAGSAGKKDDLIHVLEGMAMLEDTELSSINLRIIGMTRAQLVEICGVSEPVIDNLGSSLKIVGRIPREGVLRHLEEADFTVLLRSPALRYTKAGFPTKVVESLASATPVICNLTSDLDEYLTDGVNSIIVKACAAEAFAAAVRGALTLSPEQKTTMQQEARKCAEEHFDYRIYDKDLETLCQSAAIK